MRENTALPHRLCYQVKFGTSATKDVRITGKEPQKLGSAEIPPLAVGAWLTPNSTSFPTCYRANFVSLRQTVLP